MGRLWRIPTDPKKRTPGEEKTLELLDHFLEYAVEMLEAKGYVALTVKHHSTPQWNIVRIYFGRQDVVKRFLREVRKGYERIW